MKKRWKALRDLLGPKELSVPIGLALLGVGLWMRAPWLGLAVPGAIVLLIALAPLRRFI